LHEQLLTKIKSRINSARLLSRWPSEHVIHIRGTLPRAACGPRVTSWKSLPCVTAIQL